MINWYRTFNIIQPVKSFPRVKGIGCEAWITPDYRNEGINKPKNSNHGIFQYSLSGYGVFEYKNKQYPVRKGSAFICINNDPKQKYYYPEESDESWEIIHCSIFGENAGNMIKDITARHGHVFNLPADKGIIKRLRDFGSAEKVKSIIMSPADNCRLAMEILTSLMKSRESEVNDNPANIIISRAQQEIQNHISENINITELAEILDISREHLSRVFRTHTGQTLQKHILQHKIRTACHLLKDTDLSIKEIAGRLGFDKAVNFSRTFSRQTRMSPRKFRVSGSIMEV
ncbi:MAG: helix-turn-helix domain-containing protein [Planctomycetota bacterium]|jgi:AraC-like DNA-binding protein